MLGNLPYTHGQITCLKKGDSIFITRSGRPSITAEITSVAKKYVTATSTMHGVVIRFDAVSGREVDSYCTVTNVFANKQAYLNYMEAKKGVKNG